MALDKYVYDYDYDIFKFKPSADYPIINGECVSHQTHSAVSMQATLSK